jgi:hypothetical protein
MKVLKFVLIFVTICFFSCATSKVLTYTDADGIVYIAGKKTARITGYTGTGTDIIIPESFKGKNIYRIESNAFNNKQLTSVTFSRNLVYIGLGAFANNKLTHITINESISVIDSFVFYNNPLKVVTIEKFNKKPNVSIGEYRGESRRGYANLDTLSGTFAANALRAGVYTREDTGWTFNGNPAQNYASLLLDENLVVKFFTPGNKGIYHTYFYTGNPPRRKQMCCYVPVGETTVDVSYHYFDAVGIGHQSSSSTTNVLLKEYFDIDNYSLIAEARFDNNIAQFPGISSPIYRSGSGETPGKDIFGNNVITYWKSEGLAGYYYVYRIEKSLIDEKMDLGF